MSALLVPEQEDALKGLRRSLERILSPAAGAPARGPLVAAVVGPRGVGKTTILRELKKSMPRSVVSTEIIDASIVRDDFGLAAAAIEALHQSLVREVDARSASELLRGHGRGGSFEPWDTRYKRLGEKHKECLEAALMQEESHRKLAQDLAMSPGHYGKLVLDAVNQKRLIPEQVNEYLKQLRDAHLHLGSRPGEPLDLVVTIDDLDLADPKLVQSFVRSILTDYARVNLHWVLAFDRARMIHLLSDRLDESRPPDLTVGQALLTKLTPFHHQHELHGWSFAERRGFRLLAEDPDGPPLDKLLVDAKQVELLPLLPAQPRALEGIYSWLRDARDGASGKVALTVEDRVRKVEEGIRKVALASGQSGIERQLVHRGAARLATTFAWDPDAALSRRGWAELASAASADEPVWGLPLPREFDRIVSGTVPEAYLEALLDLALAAEEISPYQLLGRLSFARREMLAAKIGRSFSDDEIGSYLSRPSRSRVLAVGWQEWQEESKGAGPRDNKAQWGVSIGPAALWQVLYGLRSPTPTDLLQGLYLPQTAFESASPGPSTSPEKKPDEILPRRTRALLLLMGGIVRAPWREVEAAWGFWGALAVTRAVAALTLSAYAWGIWGDKDPPLSPLHAAATESAAAIVSLSQAELQKAYDAFLTSLVTRCAKDKFTPDSPGHLARSELQRALEAMLAQPAVRDIARE